MFKFNGERKPMTQMPVYPDYDTLVRSVNARSAIYGRASDDPLFGVPITQAMWDRAKKARA